MSDLLRHPDPEERRRAAAALWGPSVSRVAEVLFSLLDDPDWRVRREAALALARDDDPSTIIPRLLDSVESGDVSRRNAAIESMRAIGSRAVGPTLERLKEASGPARRFLIEVLAGIGTEEGIDALEQFLDDPDPNLPPAATEALGNVAGPRAELALQRALAHRDPVVRLAALQAFVRRSVALPFDRIEQLLDDPLCRRVALRAAALSDDPRAIEAMIAAFSASQPTVSSEAAVACAIAARRGHAEQASRVLKTRADAVVILSGLAWSPMPEVRQAAVECIGLTGDPQGMLPVLVACESPVTAAAGGAALDRFGADAVPAALACASQLGSLGVGVLLRWGMARARREHASLMVETAWKALSDGIAVPIAWEVLGEFGQEVDAQRMVERLSHLVVDTSELRLGLSRIVGRFPQLADVLRREIAVESRMGLLVSEVLASHGHPISVERVRVLLNDNDPSVRAAAARTLGVSGDRSALDALEFAMADENPDVQSAAASAIGRLGLGIDSLSQSLRASDARVRQAAARAVGLNTPTNWGPQQVRELLLPLLHDPEPSVVLAVIDGLGSRLMLDELVSLTQHEDPDVVAEVLVRLREREPHAAHDAALRLLDHAAWVVRLEAVRCIDASRTDGREILGDRARRERDEMVAEAITSVLSNERRQVP